MAPVRGCAETRCSKSMCAYGGLRRGLKPDGHKGGPVNVIVGPNGGTGSGLRRSAVPFQTRIAPHSIRARGGWLWRRFRNSHASLGGSTGRGLALTNRDLAPSVLQAVHTAPVSCAHKGFQRNCISRRSNETAPPWILRAAHLSQLSCVHGGDPAERGLTQIKRCCSWMQLLVLACLPYGVPERHADRNRLCDARPGEEKGGRDDQW